MLTLKAEAERSTRLACRSVFIIILGLRGSGKKCHARNYDAQWASKDLNIPVCARRVNLFVYSLSLHRHSYIGFILAFASSIHNKQQNAHHVPLRHSLFSAVGIRVFSFLSHETQSSVFLRTLQEALGIEIGDGSASNVEWLRRRTWGRECGALQPSPL